MILKEAALCHFKLQLSIYFERTRKTTNKISHDSVSRNPDSKESCPLARDVRYISRMFLLGVVLLMFSTTLDLLQPKPSSFVSYSTDSLSRLDMTTQVFTHKLKSHGTILL